MQHVDKHVLKSWPNGSNAPILGSLVMDEDRMSPFGDFPVGVCALSFLQLRDTQGCNGGEHRVATPP